MHYKELVFWLVLISCLFTYSGEGARGYGSHVEQGAHSMEGVSYVKLEAQGQSGVESPQDPLKVDAAQLSSLDQRLSPKVKPKLYVTSKGIKVLLVSDSTMLESAFSFGVGCGYYQDPDNLAGLAHLMEHVVFLGSQENPNPVGWDEFLLKKGGVSNAYTSADSTVFYILSSPKELDSIIGYFTKMLVTPVIDERSSISEIDAVNQEHEKNIPNKVRAMVELAMYLSPEGSPARKFGTGSKETLYVSSKKNNISLKNALKEYHESCYTSDNVSIVIMGPQSNEELAKIAEKADSLFTKSKGATKGLSKMASVSNGRLASRGTSKSQHYLAPSIFENYGSKQSNIGITSGGGITTKKDDSPSRETKAAKEPADSSKLEIDLIKMPKGESSPPYVIIYWDTTSDSLSILRENAEWQMLKLIQYFFEDQSQNSIASQLHKRKLATGLEYFDNTSTQYSIYGLLFTATDDSDATTTEIAKLTSSYMQSLIEQINNDERWIQSFYKNYTSMANIKYEFDEERDTSGIVSQAAESLLIFPDEPEMALSAFIKPVSSSKGSDLSEEQIEALRSLTKYLSPSKMKVIKLSDSLDGSSGKKLRFEPYKTEYSVSKISLGGSSDGSEEKEMARSTNRIGELLTCVPGDLEIIKFSADKCPKYKSYGKEVQERQIRSELQPCPVLEEEGISIFWKGPIHNVPSVHLTLVQRLASKDVSDNIRIGLLGRLHAQIQTARMDSGLSRFKQCGLDATIKYIRGRFIIIVQSYSSNFEQVIGQLSSHLIGEKRVPTKAEFEGALAHIKSEILNLSEEMAYDVASDIAQSAYLSNYHSKLQLRESLQKSEITYNEYLEVLKSVFSVGYFDSFVVGNIEADKSMKLVSAMVGSLTSKRIPYSGAVHDGVIEIPGDIHIKVNNPISSDHNNAVVAHYLSPPTDLIDVSVYSSIGEILNSPFYDTLRTEWQDGYIAFATTKYETPIISLIGAVQSAERMPETLVCHLLSALKSVSKDVEEDLKEISKSEFEERIRWFGLSRFSTQKLDSFNNYVEHFSKLIISHELCFEKNKLIENATQAFISEPGVYIEKLNKLTRPSSSRRLVIVEVIGDSNPEVKSEEKLVSVADGEEPPTSKECKEILSSELGKAILMSAASPQSGSSSGKLRASRSSSLQDARKVVMYDSDLQCNISDQNASSASGKDLKEIRDMLSLFRNRISSGGELGQAKANRDKSSHAQDMGGKSSVARNKRVNCDHSRI
ncbi:secreted insulinase-like peptidase [Cryptosporidium canis]|nr:secreted insulinase-like peptidase [Cryptosporidium canis]